MPDVKIDHIQTTVQSVDQQNLLSPEVIKKVTEKVYEMLLHDLRLEAERKRRTNPSSVRYQGGR